MFILSIVIFMQGVIAKDVLLTSTKTWLRNTNFNNPLNWDLGRVPCSQDNVIFPRSMGFVVQLPEGETILRQLVLPSDGELLLPLNGNLQMSQPNPSDKNDNCHGTDIIFSQWKSSWWVDPESWGGHNTATPDLEAIPCTSDRVIFPKESSFSVIMPYTPVRVTELNVAGKDFGSEDWIDLMSKEVGQTQFFTRNGRSIPEIHVSGRPCTDITGCECNNEYLREDVCNIMKEKCRNTPCFSPVIPYGSCCPICGAYLLFKYNEQFEKTKLETYLRNKLSDENIDFHVSKVHGEIQVVFFERNGYEERTQSLADKIRKDVIKRSDLGLTLNAEFVAGAHVSPPSVKRQAIIFVGFMFVVACMFGLLFYSYTDMCNKRTRNGKQYDYVAFENQTEEIKLYGATALLSKNKQISVSNKQSFDNPMYGSAAEVESSDQNNSDGSQIYSILEEIKLDKEDFEEEVAEEKDML